MDAKKRVAYAVCFSIVSANAVAAEPNIATANTGRFLFDARWRIESVSDDAFAKNALADTVRARFGYKTASYNDWSALIELEGTQHLFNEDFNSTANGQVAYPAVVDPDNTELNQAYVRYAPSANTDLNVGRQRIQWDNQRFFGNVGWRQNEQTFDAIDFQHKFSNGLAIRYDYLDRVQRINGADNPNINLARWKLNMNLFGVSHKLGPGTLTAYGHFIENETLPLSSHRNIGIRYVAKHDAPDALGWLATAEYAKQDSYAHGKNAIDADYLFLEGGLVWKANTFKAGWEQLSGDGNYGFATPFATLHAFNGWADRFLTTPVNGLQDSYLSWNRKFGKINANIAWHDFQSDHLSIHYGQELDASLGYAFNKHWNGLLKIANYKAQDIGFDVTKTWLSMEYVY
jgi:hypothetical protein